MLQKGIRFFLCGLLTLSLAACGASGSPSVESQVEGASSQVAPPVSPEEEMALLKEQADATKKQMDALQEQQDALRKELDTLLEEFRQTSSLDEGGEEGGHSLPEPSTEAAAAFAENIAVSFLDKTVKKSGPSEVVELSIQVENKFDKDIQGIQGTLRFGELFGETDFILEREFSDKVIPAGKAAIFFEPLFSTNLLSPIEQTIMDSPLNSLRAEFVIHRVAFTDGEVLE